MTLTVHHVVMDEWMSFMDEWSRFYGRQELYARDGVHLSRKGVKEFSECLERAVRQSSQKTKY